MATKFCGRARSSLSITASFFDVKKTLGFTIVLVVIVIFAFLRSLWATVIPSVTVPLSLVGSFAILYLGGYSLDNLSLMALTLAVGLVVDDAVVMLENIFRYLEEGDDALTAALKGSAEIGFTIVTAAIILSALIALTLSPMMAALFLKDPRQVRHGRLYQWSERAFNTGRMFISLKPESQRDPIGAVIQRLRGERAKVPGITTYLQPVVSIRIGGRLTHAVSIHAARRRLGRALSMGAQAHG
jgi:multidrug efflux pump subunit AcrB